LESLKERDHLKDQGIDGRMRSQMDLREIGWGRCGVDSSGSG
jgi:hypothetical protein